MAGMRIVVVKTGANGDIDIADLRARAEEHSANLAALMVTYPSTHGVFEEGDHRDLPHRAPAWRTGLHGRREHERDGRPGTAG